MITRSTTKKMKLENKQPDTYLQFINSISNGDFYSEKVEALFVTLKDDMVEINKKHNLIDLVVKSHNHSRKQWINRILSSLKCNKSLIHSKQLNMQQPSLVSINFCIKNCNMSNTRVLFNNFPVNIDDPIYPVNLINSVDPYPNSCSKPFTIIEITLNRFCVDLDKKLYWFIILGANIVLQHKCDDQNRYCHFNNQFNNILDFLKNTDKNWGVNSYPAYRRLKLIKIYKQAINEMRQELFDYCSCLPDLNNIICQYLLWDKI